jgi:hypothetical protein
MYVVITEINGYAVKEFEGNYTDCAAYVKAQGHTASNWYHTQWAVKNKQGFTIKKYSVIPV